MALIRGLFVTDTRIDDLILDVATLVEHTFDAEVTSHPVTKGETISDHVIPQPDVVTIAGVVSRTPLNPILVALSRERYDTAFEKLRNLKEKPRLITLVTARRTYPDMVLTSARIPDGVDTGDSLDFSATFKHVRQVQTLVTSFSDSASRPDAIPVVKSLGQQSPIRMPDGTSLGGLIPL